MRGKYIDCIGLIVLLILCAVLFGCNKEDLPNTYTLEDFKQSMANEGYVFEIQDAEKDFIETTRKRMIIEDIVIDMYLFESDKDMEGEAANIDSNGCGYDNGKFLIQVSWINPPHFYKRGSLIVQYVGEDQNVISSLTKILGQQFAGL